MQQGIEKLLKVLIAARGELYPFTHDLNKLLAVLDRLGEKVSLQASLVAVLNAAAVQWRYQLPEALGETQIAESRAALEEVETLVYRRLSTIYPDVAWSKTLDR